MTLIRKNKLIFMFALAFVFGCGEHSIEEILFGDSSSSGEEISSSSDDDVDNLGGVAPPTDTIPTPPSITNSQGTVIVEPLLKTKWGGGTSSFDPFYTLPDGQIGWILCANVATAQIMKYHEHPKRGSGWSRNCEPCTFYEGQEVVLPSVSLEIDYDWGNMLNTYRNVNNVTEQQQKAILTLLHHVALTWYINNFTNNFGYDKSLSMYERKYYDDSEWASIIKEQLNLGLPVLASGKPLAGGNGHAFVIDGYDNKDKFHINWGWGGIADGYYPIDSLTPHGRSLREGYHNIDYKIYTNIKPDEGGVPGYREPALDNFKVGKVYVSQNESFNIKAEIHVFGTFRGQVGTALIDNRDSIVKYLGIKNFTTNYNMNYNMDVSIPEDINPGKYTLRMATRVEGGEWKLITLSDHTKNIPSAITLTIPNGLVLTEFSSEKILVLAKETFDVKIKAKNYGQEKFLGGQIGAALIDNRGNIVEIIGNKEVGELNAGSEGPTYTITSKVPETVPAGQYNLGIVIKPTGVNEWRIVSDAVSGNATINFTVITPCSGGTVKIGTQTWQKCNLNVVPSTGISKCYDNDESNCDKYGRLYDWETANTVCPSGWHLPSDSDWQTLVDFVGGKDVAGKKLKAKIGWNGNGNGEDTYGFSALPGGDGFYDGTFDYVGDYGYWWSSSENESYNAWIRGMYYGGESVGYGFGNKSILYSVRCVRD